MMTTTMEMNRERKGASVTGPAFQRISTATSSTRASPCASFLTSLEVFRMFIRPAGGVQNNKTSLLDASGVISKECYELWLKSRGPTSGKDDPPKAFRRALVAHATGTDGRTPFSQAEEEAVFKVLRKKEPWPCFINPDGTNLYKQMGFRSKGFHERRLAGETPESDTRKRAKHLPDTDLSLLAASYMAKKARRSSANGLGEPVDEEDDRTTTESSWSSSSSSSSLSDSEEMEQSIVENKKAGNNLLSTSTSAATGTAVGNVDSATMNRHYASKQARQREEFDSLQNIARSLPPPPPLFPQELTSSSSQPFPSPLLTSSRFAHQRMSMNGMNKSTMPATTPMGAPSVVRRPTDRYSSDRDFRLALESFPISPSTPVQGLAQLTKEEENALHSLLDDEMFHALFPDDFPAPSSQANRAPVNAVGAYSCILQQVPGKQSRAGGSMNGRDAAVNESVEDANPINFSEVSADAPSAWRDMMRLVALGLGYTGPSPTRSSAEEIGARVSREYPDQYVLTLDCLAGEWRNKILSQNQRAIDAFGPMTPQHGGYSHRRVPSEDSGLSMSVMIDVLAFPGRVFHVDKWRLRGADGKYRWAESWLVANKETNLVVERGRFLE